MVERKLSDGSRIELRAVRPTDKEGLEAAFARLSPASRYRRFFAPMQRLSQADLRYLTEVDHRDHEAVVAIGPDGELIGVVRYVRREQPGEAEVAVVVADEWQGRGVATALLERLIERAARNGIEHFVALVLQENSEALELFRGIAPNDPAPRRMGNGQVELVIDVPTGGISGTLLGRALRTAASGRVVIHPWRIIKRRLEGRSTDGAPGEGSSAPGG